MTDGTISAEEVAALRRELAEAQADLVEARRKVAPQGRNIVRGTETWFNRSSLRDPVFFHEHKAEILAAARAGRIVDDGPAPVTGLRQDRAKQAAAGGGKVAPR